MKRKIIVLLTGLAFAYLIYCTFQINGVLSLKTALSNNAALETTYYVTQIVAAFCVVIGALVGIWQYVLTARAERNKLNADCIQKAVDLASYYKDSILSKYKPIVYVFKETGLLDILHTVKTENIKNFDELELNSILSEHQRKAINTIIGSDKFIQAVLQAEQIFDMDLKLDRNTTLTRDHTQKTVTVAIDRNAVVQKFMSNTVTEVLNNLEFFCMHFTHKTADESVVYQSLHQTFLNIVYVLYYNIAVANKVNESKYYTNIIELYDIWNKRNFKEMYAKSETMAKAAVKGTVVHKI